MGLIKFFMSVGSLVFFLVKPLMADTPSLAEIQSLSSDLQAHEIVDHPLVKSVVDSRLGTYPTTTFVRDDLGRLKLLTVDDIPDFDFEKSELFYADQGGNIINVDLASVSFKQNVLVISLDQLDVTIPEDSLTVGRLAFGGNVQGTDRFIVADDLKARFEAKKVEADQIRYKTDMSQYRLAVRDASINVDRGFSVDLNHLDLSYVKGVPGINLHVDGSEVRGHRVNHYIADIEQLTEFSLHSYGNYDQGFITTAKTGNINRFYGAIGSITFEALDNNGGANRLDVTVFQDDENDRYFLESRFQGGDQIVVEAYSFRLESEKDGDDAVVGLEYRFKEHDIDEYLQTMAGLLDFDYINNFLAVSDGKIRISVGGERGGVEFIYMNPGLIRDPDRMNTQEQLALGIGIFGNSADQEKRTAVGVLLSADSSLTYNVRHGDLSWNNFDLPDHGEIPGTLSLYFRRKVVDMEYQLTFGRTFIEDDITMASFSIVREMGKGRRLKWDLGLNEREEYSFGITREIIFQKPQGVDKKTRRAHASMSEAERKHIIFAPFENYSTNF